MIERLVLFGATGDLAGRYLLPAVAELMAADELPDGFELVGAAQEDMDDAAFRRAAAEQLERYAGDVPAGAREALLDALSYRRVDVTDPDDVAEAIRGDRPLAAYLALPPGVFAAAVRALGAAGLPAGSRIVLEKPFGEDLDSAVALNRLLAGVSGAEGEHAVFRVDHFLGMATVQNLLGMRLANRVVEEVWNGTQIEQVDIVWEETLALEGRAGYYDSAGQLKDMIQNHLLQVLCLIAMEPPASLGEQDLRDRKRDVLRTVRPLSPDDVVVRTRRARYTAGRIGGRQIPAYADEEGVDPSRGTETFAEVVLELDSWRWSGTRVRIRTGKALGTDRMEVVVRFRPVPRLPFGDERAAGPPPNELRIKLTGTQGLTLSLTGSQPGRPPGLVPLEWTAELPEPALPEYARVLLAVLHGDSTLSIRGDEAELAWRIVTPVLDAWAEGRVPLEEYPAGSDGPVATGGQGAPDRSP